MSVAEKLAALKRQKSKENLALGEAFLAENANRGEVVALASGLQYEILEKGYGDKPTLRQQVTCHYHGTSIDGKVFDSSVQRGRPATFKLNAVIEGWQEGVRLMPKGAKYRFFIPPHLAYGDNQVSTIAPNSTLIFEVELIDFK
jgi:FKBP-type peptidyl-prolyl cis-trans isomerase FklB